MEVVFSLCVVLMATFNSAISQNSCTAPNLTPAGLINASSLITLECYTSSNPSTYMWQVNGIDNSHNQFRWIINNPQSGIYRCGYMCSNGTLLWSNNAIIITPPSNVHIAVANNNTMQVTLNCTSSGGYPNPNITWYSGNTVVGTGATLIIGSASLSGSGIYTCVAMNSAGYSNSSAIITVISDATSTSLTEHLSSSKMTTLTSMNILTSTPVPITESTTTTQQFPDPSTTVTSMQHLLSTIVTSTLQLSSTTVTSTQQLPSTTAMEPSPTNNILGDTIGFAVSLVFAGFGGLMGLFFIALCTYWIVSSRREKRRRQDDKRTLVENDENELALATINENFKAEEDRESLNSEVEAMKNAMKNSVISLPVTKQISSSDDNLPQEVPLVVPPADEKINGKEEEVTMIDDVDGLNKESSLNYQQLHQLVQEFELLSLQGRANESELVKQYKSIPQNMQLMDLWPAETHSKNRYRNVIPNKETAVILKESSGESSYINANYILGHESTEPAYICTQGPLYETIPDFWQMVWQCDITTILMLCKVVEGGKNKCAKYWPPPDENDTQTYGRYVVRNNFEETLQYYKVVYLSIHPLNEDLSTERDVCLFLFTGWPDFGVPKEFHPILELREAVELNRTSGPLLVHCSAGIGRTGTYTVLDVCIQQYNETSTVNPCYWMQKMREQRGGMIQTEEQYTFLLMALANYITRNPKQ